MSLRYYANGPATTLSANIGSGDTSMTVGSVSGFPTNFPYTLILDKDESTEEVVEVSAAVGTTLTITRAVDSTTAFAHTSGAVVFHGISARDIREANTHVNTNSAVHGVTGSLVGTSDSQSLTNKTITLSSFTGTVADTAISGTSTYSAKSISAQAETTGTIPLTVTGIASQAADLVKVQKSDATKVVSVSKDGRVGICTNGAPSSSTLWLKACAASDVTVRLTAIASQSDGLIVFADSSNVEVGRIGTDASVTFLNIDSTHFNDWASYSPAFSGHNGVVTSTGRWRRIGKKTVAFTAEGSFSGAGSGSSNVQFQLPTTPARTVRQVFAGHAEAPYGALNAVLFTGGSGTTVDRLLFVSDTSAVNLTGSLITASSILTISGVYEEA